MKSLEQMQLAWQTIAENRVAAAQNEGVFDNLDGIGRPLEEIMDITDPFGWMRRSLRDCTEMRPTGPGNASSSANAPASGEPASPEQHPRR